MKLSIFKKTKRNITLFIFLGADLNGHVGERNIGDEEIMNKK